MRCYHFFIFEIIVERVNLMQMSIENYYHHDGEQLGFHKKVHIKTSYIARNEEFGIPEKWDPGT